MGDKALKPKRQRGDDSQASYTPPFTASPQSAAAPYAARISQTAPPESEGTALAEASQTAAESSPGSDTASGTSAPPLGGHSLSRFAILPGGQVPSAASPIRAQAKMSVSQPGEPAEVEAEAMADSVMRMPAPSALPERAPAQPMPLRLPRLHADSTPTGSPSKGIARAASPAAEQMGVEGDVDQDGADAAPAVNNALSGSGGQALDSNAQQFLGERMGQDFSHVRIHADETAARSADAVNAQAYTVGNNVVFGRGQYQPGTSFGKKLLAHELTHVVQQTGGAARTPTAKVSRFRQSRDADGPSSDEAVTPDTDGATAEMPQTGARRGRRGSRRTNNTPDATPLPQEEQAERVETAPTADTRSTGMETPPSAPALDSRSTPPGSARGPAENPPAADTNTGNTAAAKNANQTTDETKDTAGKAGTDGANSSGKTDKTDKPDKKEDKSAPGDAVKASPVGTQGGDAGAPLLQNGAATASNGAALNPAVNPTAPGVVGTGAGIDGNGGTQNASPAADSTAMTADVPDRQPGNVIAADDDAAAAFPPETRMGRTANGFTLFETDAPSPQAGADSGTTVGGTSPDVSSVAATSSASTPPGMTVPGNQDAATSGTNRAVVGGASNALPLARKPNPVPPQEGETTTGDAPRGRSFPVPPSTATQMAGHQRERIQQALSEFLAFGQERAVRINALSDNIAPRIQASTQQAHASIDSALQRGLGSVSSSIGKARETAISRADTARQSVRAQHAQLVSDMTAATVAAKQSADQEYTAGVATLDPLLQQNLQALDPLYEQSGRSLREKANQTATKAQPLAAAKAGEYNGQTPEHSKGLFGLGAVLDNLDWDTYVSNWRRAKVTAAQEKATEFEQKLRQDADKVVAGQSGAKGQIATGFTEQTNKARTDMSSIRAASGGAFDTLQQEKLQTAQQTLDGQLSSIDTQLQATLGELSALESTKQNELQSQAAQQKAAVTQAGAAATTALQMQVTQAAQGVSEQVAQVAASVRQMRQAGAARSAIEAAKQSLEGSAGQAQNGIAQAIDSVDGKLSAQGESSSQQVDQAAQSAGSEADQKAQAFGSQMDQAASAAGQEFNGLRQQHQQAMQAATARLKETYKARADQLKQGFTTAIERQRQEFTKTETEFGNRAEQSFGELPATMEAAATEAASKVQPGWKFWAKIIVTIAVAIVCAVVVAALVASGVGIILAGVLVGAAAGLASQALNDIIDGKMSSLTDYLVSGVSGAVGGLIGGGAGVLGKALTAEGGAIMSALSRPAMQAAARFGTTLGLDTAGNVAGGFVDFGLKSAAAMWQGSAAPDFNLREIVGMGLFSAALGKGIGSGMERTGMNSAINSRFGTPETTGGTSGTTGTDAPASNAEADLPTLPVPETAPANRTAASNGGGDTQTPTTALPDAPLPLAETPQTRTTDTDTTPLPVGDVETPGTVSAETRGPGDLTAPPTETVAPPTEATPALAEPTTAPSESTPQDARTRYQAERQAVRQADYEQFRQNKISELRSDPRTANLSDVEIETAVRTARRQGQLSPADQYRMRYHLDAPTGRAAEIDARTGANYQRLIEQRIASQEFQYRYTTDRVKGFYENDGRISRPTYMTDEHVTSNSESMSRAQVAEEWGRHTTGIEIPRGAVTDVRVPRPFGDSPHVKRGWEPFTNSYPEYGRGGALQYKATTNSYDPNWAHPLENNYGQPTTRSGAPTNPVAVSEVTPAPVGEPVVAGTTPEMVVPPTEAVPPTKASETGTTPADAEPLQQQEQLQQQQIEQQGKTPPTTDIEAQQRRSQQEQDLIAATKAEAERVLAQNTLSPRDPNYLTNKERGPVQSGVLDMDAPQSEYHLGRNSPDQQPPADLHPFLEERIAQRTAEYERRTTEIDAKEQRGETLTREEQAVKTAGAPGYHSEIYALNKAIRAREQRLGRELTPQEVKAALDRFLLHNVNLVKNQGVAPGEASPPRCTNCYDIVEGVTRTQPVKNSERRYQQEGIYNGSISPDRSDD